MSAPPSQTPFERIVEPIRHDHALVGLQQTDEFLETPWWPSAVARWRRLRVTWAVLDEAQRDQLVQFASDRIERRPETPHAEQKLAAMHAFGC